MSTYTFTAKNATTGQKVTSTVQADNERAASKAIQDQGLSPLEIKLEKTGGFGKKVKAKDRILFARQLSTLISAGLPLVQSLYVLSMFQRGSAMTDISKETPCRTQNASSD